MQIILMMSKEHVRLAIPKGSSLPGPKLAGNGLIHQLDTGKLEVLLAKAHAALLSCMPPTAAQLCVASNVLLSPASAASLHLL